MENSPPRLGDDARPAWFGAFLVDCGPRKPSPHTLKAYRQDFDAIARILVGDPQQVANMHPDILTVDTTRRAFATFAQTHEPASIRRCWSTWNVLCTYLFTDGVIAANPMPAVGRPKMPKTLPKSFGTESVIALVNSLGSEDVPRRGSDWPERDRAIVLTALLTGMRSDELIRANIGDIRVKDDRSAMVHVRGKGNRDRSIPVEPLLLKVLESYLATRVIRCPPPARARRRTDMGLTTWPRKSCLFVGANGERITRGVLQYRIQRAYRQAGVESQREKGALVHALRHTYATGLANENVSVYTLMKLLGHESMATAQRYVSSAGADTRPAAARNPVYGLISAAATVDPISSAPNQRSRAAG